MKTINKVLTLFLVISPMTIFGHDGHVHTGTFWENAVHFIFTNMYFVAPVLVAGYFLTKHMRSRQKVKNSAK